MTSPTDIRRLLNRITNQADIAAARLDPAITNIRLNTADSLPTTASGNATGGPRATSELTPTENAAHTNLGDLYGYDQQYRPGPTIQLADLEVELQAAYASMQRAQRVISDIGLPPFVTQHLRCPGINGAGCDGWTDTDRETGGPRRADRLCIDCGRTTDLARRALRDRRRYHSDAT